MRRIAMSNERGAYRLNKPCGRKFNQQKYDPFWNFGNALDAALKAKEEAMQQSPGRVAANAGEQSAAENRIMKTVKTIDDAPRATKNIVLYHEDADGFGAAYAAWVYFGASAEYHAVNYGDPLPPIPDKSNVFILDFSYDAETLRELAVRSNFVIVIDHHKTAQKELEKLVDGGCDERFFKIFDTEHSGCVLAWRFFSRYDVPRLLKYVEDRDLWRFKLTNSRAINAVISTEPFDFDAWLTLEVSCEFTPNRCILLERGAAMLTLGDFIAKQAAKHAVPMMLGKYLVPTANCTAFISETCHEMLELYPEMPFVAAYFDNLEKRRRVWSLRSRPGFDVSAVAVEHGGGGHPQAAGFEEPLHQLDDRAVLK
ncbi:MAG: DHH family phosphoesterase [Chthoniobacteraceae bacterium]